MFIYAEFEIIKIFFKRKTLKKAGVRSRYATFSKKIMFIPRFQFGHGNLV